MPWQIWALIRRCNRAGSGRHSFLVGAHACLSVVLSPLQKDCGPRPISSKEMRMRRRRADSVFLHGLLELEHLSHLDLALRRLSVEGRDLGGRVSCSYRPVEMA